MERKEWGSNFCEKLYDTNSFLLDSIQTMYFDTGRSALRYLLSHLKIKEKRVMLPQYICESMISPFEESGYNIFYYSIGADFKIKQKELEKNVQELKPKMILVQTYFGFDTLEPIREYLNNIRKKGIIIIEDITHSIFSNTWKICSDYKIGSLRKWCSIPDGGVLINLLQEPQKTFINGNKLQENISYVEMRLEAQRKKSIYLESLNKDNTDLKKDFIELFDQSERLLDGQKQSFTMSKYTREHIKGINWNKMALQRRRNYNYLETLMQNITDVKLTGLKLEEDTVPLYYPIYVKNGKRDRLRKDMFLDNIMLPVIWPTPLEVKEYLSDQVKKIYNEILTIPCDQRYGKQDMIWIAEKIQKHMGEIK